MLYFSRLGSGLFIIGVDFNLKIINIIHKMIGKIISIVDIISYLFMALFDRNIHGFLNA